MNSEVKRKTRISLIAAVAQNGIIGRGNALPWRLSDDLKRFKALTLDHSIVMGRKTWDSLGRPLPNRRHIVLSRQNGFRAAGALVVHSLEEAIAHCANEDEVFVIGGAQLYADALPYVDCLYLTEVHEQVAGDTRFPQLPKGQFTEVRRESHAADERNEFAFDFAEYRRERGV